MRQLEISRHCLIVFGTTRECDHSRMLGTTRKGTALLESPRTTQERSVQLESDLRDKAFQQYLRGPGTTPECPAVSRKGPALLASAHRYSRGLCTAQEHAALLESAQYYSYIPGTFRPAHTKARDSAGVIPRHRYIRFFVRSFGTLIHQSSFGIEIASIHNLTCFGICIAVLSNAGAPQNKNKCRCHTLAAFKTFRPEICQLRIGEGIVSPREVAQMEVDFDGAGARFTKFDICDFPTISRGLYNK